MTSLTDWAGCIPPNNNSTVILSNGVAVKTVSFESGFPQIWNRKQYQGYKGYNIRSGCISLRDLNDVEAPEEWED